MILLHKPIQIVDKTVPSVLSILKVSSDVDRLHWTDFLTHSAENATELVYFVYDRITVSLIVFAANKSDTVSWANRGTQAASNALWSTVCVLLHDVSSPPARTQLRHLFWILLRHLSRVDHMLKGQGHPAERRPQIGGRLWLRSLHYFD